MDRTIIVLGNTVTALGTLRALKPLKGKGFKIVSATTGKEENIAYRSNIPDRKIILEDGLIQGLLRIGGTFPDKPVLLFTRDDEIVAVNQNRKEMEQYYTFLLPEQSTVDMLMEKMKFAEFAVAEKLSVPETVFVRGEDQLRDLADTLPFPFIVKPYLMHAGKIDDKAQLDEFIARLEPVHYQSMIAQEYVEGMDDNIFFCFLLFDAAGKVVHSMIARKLRQWPVSYGTTSLAVTVANKRLEEEVQKFIEATEMAGYCSIEYKYDPKTDRYLIMEPTIGRFNQQIALTIACGVNFPVAAVRLLVGEEVHIKEQKNDVFWIYESNDLFSYFKSETRYGYLENFFKPNVLVLFSLSDPGPIFYEVFSLGKKKMRKILRNV